ncbi:MAG: TIGR01212 family radical SAM protein [Ruminococcus sp.]|nr:TIGR01212 family radical SAM protein [Ruminococcus sp.]
MPLNRSPFIYSTDNKRYYTLNTYFRTVYGEKLYKAVIDCGFTCPNIDGTKGRGGCIFCDGGSGYFTDGSLDTASQLEKEYARITEKNGKAGIIVYFQANTNTYAPAARLREIFESVLEYPFVKGLSIGTRADCLPDDVMELLCDLGSRTALTVELGMQTVHDETISLINRCCTHEEFLVGYNKLKSCGIRICLHIINGLPGESREMMTETARQTAMLAPDGVKLQMLHVIRGTRLAEMYENGSVPLLSRDEYIDTVVSQLEVLPPETVIERITGDGDKRKLIAPLWSADKIAVLGGIDKRLAELDTWQGRLYRSSTDK